jgi:hypothetical protein
MPTPDFMKTSFASFAVEKFARPLAEFLNVSTGGELQAQLPQRRSGRRPAVMASY